MDVYCKSKESLVSFTVGEGGCTQPKLYSKKNKKLYKHKLLCKGELDWFSCLKDLSVQQDKQNNVLLLHQNKFICLL